MSRAYFAAAVPTPTSGGRLSVSRASCWGVGRRTRSLLGTDPRGVAVSAGRSAVLAAALVSSDALEDGGWIALDHARDFRPAVVTLWVVADEPPQLMAGCRYRLSAARSAELPRGDSAMSTNVIDQLAQAAQGERIEDGVGADGDRNGHGPAHPVGSRSGGPSMRTV